MMPYLKNDDLMLLNDLIFAVYSIKDAEEMRKHFLEVLRLLIPFHCASFFLADLKLENPLINMVGVDIDEEKRVSYEKYYYKLDYARKFNYVLNPVVFRETDIFGAAERENTEYFNDYLQPDVFYISSVFLANREGLQGNFNLCRKKRENDLEERDLFILKLLIPHLLNRLSQYKLSEMTSEYNEATLFQLAHQYNLTNREVEVVKLLLQGFSNIEIGEKLFICVGTVKKHLSSIFEKTGHKSRTQLVSLLVNQQQTLIG